MTNEDGGYAIVLKCARRDSLLPIWLLLWYRTVVVCGSR